MPRKNKYLMLLAILMLVAKPFVGFNLRSEHYFKALQHRTSNILVKSFTKRKLEVSEDSEFSMAAISKRLADPAMPTILLLACALNVWLPRLFRQTKATTYSALAAIIYGSYQPQSLYLLSGKLTI